jgi:hypothetical protein
MERRLRVSIRDLVRAGTSPRARKEHFILRSEFEDFDGARNIEHVNWRWPANNNLSHPSTLSVSGRPMSDFDSSMSWRRVHSEPNVAFVDVQSSCTEEPQCPLRQTAGRRFLRRITSLRVFLKIQDYSPAEVPSFQAFENGPWLALTTAAWVIQTIASLEIPVNKTRQPLHIDRRRRWEQRIGQSK